VYVPSAEVTHIGGHATSRASTKMLAAHHDSAYRYLADRYQGPQWAPVLAGIKAALAVRLKLETRRTV
jgi:N-acetylglucosaminyl-diphospho-decaprenol L-rhamnosyltransferase